MRSHTETTENQPGPEEHPATAEPTVITVGEGPGTGGAALGYDVIIGSGLLSKLPGAIGPTAERVLVIHPRALRATGDVVRDDLENAGYQAVTAEIPDGEEGKHIQVAAFCWQVLGQNDFTRSDAVVAVGGGAVTDAAGFIAATWLRGVRVVHMPTTLLGMVDAAVGGKTGINTAEGKNLVGAFHQPTGVLVDLDTLLTLPRNELVAGLAEVVKCGFIADEEILRIIESAPDQVQNPHSWQLRELIERTIQVKAEIVGADVREEGRREHLNYGHTLGHAIELAERYQWRHGAAVSVGLVFAAELARSLGRLDDATVDRHRHILSMLGLPVSYRDDRWNQLLEGIRRDKKNRGDTLRFVLLNRVGQPATVEIPDPSILFATYQEIAEPASPTVAL